jgi:hypothetical protein
MVENANLALNFAGGMKLEENKIAPNRIVLLRGGGGVREFLTTELFIVLKGAAPPHPPTPTIAERVVTLKP